MKELAAGKITRRIGKAAPRLVFAPFTWERQPSSKSHKASTIPRKPSPSGLFGQINRLTEISIFFQQK
jgi:hypothetical protein